ncbi:hypothetical protein JCM19294_1157 [Nonlabens tegetincola]|uniref:Zinc finger CHC2-type domain-containing protein n=1 Tax=Nonlabens tegetincola TaxID=323273 RepID=A0A090Q532_9FLAO|nr:hypothetical protein [Nonlabens tegetincola]GAK96848.1 hypothetical protein JCM19294_1157 [Nonlabens tegetincola]
MAKRDDVIREIKEKATLKNTLADFHPERKEKPNKWILTCPSCGHEKAEYSLSKDIYKCFKCDAGASTAQSYLIKVRDYSNWDSIVEMARIESISIPKPEDNQTEIEESISEVTGTSAANAAASKARAKSKKPKISRKRLDPNKTFLQQFITGSGLDIGDVTTTVHVDQDTTKEVALYQSATIDSAFKIVPGDDVIIHYYDLYGKPVTYYRKNKQGQTVGQPLPFYRIRYSNPEANAPDKSGNHPKYRSPFGSGSKIYIPKWTREKFQKSSRIETLYIQEGEKKADKATKHGLISVGAMGIHNIASNKQLAKDFELIIKRCQVENVVFMLDSDWQDLSSNIDGTKPADLRPRSFFRAVSNFQKHFAAFSTTGIDLNIFFAHVKPNDRGDKGIDDLMTNSLDELELKALKSSTDKVLKKPDGEHQYLKFYNITTVSEMALRKYWALESIDSFIEQYRSRLRDLPKFRFNRLDWRINENGEKELAQPLTNEEMFYHIDKEKKGDRAVSFNYKRCYTFLQNRGYYRFRVNSLTYGWVHIENNVVTRKEPHQIKDYVIDFVKEMNIENVENLLYKGAKQYLGSDSLGNLDYIEPNFYKPTIDSQNLYFENKYFHVTKEKIQLLENSNAEGKIWKDSILESSPTLLKPLFEFERISHDHTVENPELKPYIGEYNLVFSEEGKKCDFLQFLNNTSKFYHRNTKEENITIDEIFETNRHLLSKITAFGYMLHDFRNKGQEFAIVGMDGMMSQVGDSNGRSGKSLFGTALEQLIPTVVMDGKTTDLQSDRFAFEELDSTHKMIFFDDVKPNFIFELLFAKITGRFTVEKKGFGKYTLPQESVIKFYIATNHALKGDGGSFEDRQRLLGFSGWYNTEWKPIDDFGVRFFDEWEPGQWNLFYNFAALALHTYLKFGIIKAPTSKLLQRKLRQDIGESFMDWANEYFSAPDKLNTRLVKDDMYAASFNDPYGPGFVIKYPTQRKYTPINVFKVKMKKYCQFKGWEFNPSKEGKDIKVAGKELFEIVPPQEELQDITRAYNENKTESDTNLDDSDLRY